VLTAAEKYDIIPIVVVENTAMLISKKCQYAVRAVFELAKRYGPDPVKIGEIAEAQAIPVRFLEAILNQLKQGGHLESRRGPDGGYLLAVPPGELTLGEIIQAIEGPQAPVDCVGGGDGDECRFYGECVFKPVWNRAQQAITGVYDNTTFQSLLDEEVQMQAPGCFVPMYVI
jgi:Rrf2 family transcriptional regulator, cysteine metabolism repressor